MTFRLQHPTPKRYTYLFAQIFMSSFLLLTARMIYFQHSYYQAFLTYEAKVVLSAIIWAVLIGIYLDTLRVFLFAKEVGSTKLTLLFALWLKIFYNVGQFLRGSGDYVKIEIDKNTKVAILAMAVKFFYIPLMINFLVGNFGSLQGNVAAITQSQITFDTVYNLLVTAIFTIDTMIFTFGYVVESPFLGSKIKSVEPTVLGWVSALATYPPFNSLSSTIFVMVSGSPTFIGQNIVAYQIVRILILVCDFIFVACSVSLGTRASNLTNRGIVKRGPYSVVRHPAYTVKLLSWFLEGVILAPNLAYFLGWAGFAFIYFMRAVTEERHLSQDPDYVTYKKQVRYRFVPGLA